MRSGQANRASLNRGPLKRARDLLGALRVVLFSPEDLRLVKGDPADRRRFIDDLVTQRRPRLAGVRADYDRVPAAVDAAEVATGRRSIDEASEATLEVWNDSLARLGGELVEARLRTLDAMAPFVADAYLAIAPTNAAMIAYRLSLLGVDPDAATFLPTS